MYNNKCRNKLLETQMNYSINYLELGAITYPPKLKMYRSILMLTAEQKNEVVKATNDSALRLYEYYINKKSWKHFNPLNYKSIGRALTWSASKTEKCKGMLVKEGYLLIKKDTLPDGTKIFRILLGKDVVSLYKLTNKFPSSEENIIYNEEGMYKSSI